jgi:hypothetical protein
MTAMPLWPFHTESPVSKLDEIISRCDAWKQRKYADSASVDKILRRVDEWNESDHPRVGSGPHGGEFTSGGGGSKGSSPSASKAASTKPIVPKIDKRTGRAIYTPEQKKQVEERAWKTLGVDEREDITDKAAYEKAKKAYAKLPDTMDGKLLSVDEARELSPDYAQSLESRSELSPQVHEPCSAFVKNLYAEKLAEPIPEGQTNTVLFTAGGTGAGKTSSLRGNKDLSEMRDEAHIIYDTNMRSLKSAEKKIQQALEANHVVQVALIDRDPYDALVKGVLPRAEHKGRTVPIASHEETHRDAVRTVDELRKKYARNPKVQFIAIDNNHGPGGARAVPFDKLPKHEANMEKMRLAVQRAYNAGEISARVYHGVLGDER